MSKAIQQQELGDPSYLRPRKEIHLTPMEKLELLRETMEEKKRIEEEKNKPKRVSRKAALEAMMEAIRNKVGKGE